MIVCLPGGTEENPSVNKISKRGSRASKVEQLIITASPWVLAPGPTCIHARCTGAAI